MSPSGYIMGFGLRKAALLLWLLKVRAMRKNRRSAAMTRNSEFDANRQLSETPRKVRPNRRVDDVDRRPLWIALVGVATLVALWWTW